MEGKPAENETWYRMHAADDGRALGIHSLGGGAHDLGVGKGRRDGCRREDVELLAPKILLDLVVVVANGHGVVDMHVPTGPLRLGAQIDEGQRRPGPGNFYDAAMIGRRGEKDPTLLCDHSGVDTSGGRRSQTTSPQKE